jgi:hypothetical protein
MRTNINPNAAGIKTTPDSSRNLSDPLFAELVPLDDALGIEDLGLPDVVAEPLKVTSLHETLNELVVSVSVIPVPLTHKGLDLFAPSVNFTLAYYRQQDLEEGSPDAKYHQGAARRLGQHQRVQTNSEGPIKPVIYPSRSPTMSV